MSYSKINKLLVTLYLMFGTNICLTKVHIANHYFEYQNLFEWFITHYCFTIIQRESARELEWLRKVKTHFGNVEAKSIDQAIAINDFGYYHVGHIEDYSKDFKV